MSFDKEKTICFTGHRPEKLNGYNPKDNIQMLYKLKESIVEMINNGYENFITGMAIGVDMWAAKIVLKLKKEYPQINLICAIPCDKHWSKWQYNSPESVEQWFSITSKADLVHYVSEDPYTAWCMQVRNKWMVDNSNTVIAVWDGTKGGTGNCVVYAFKKDVKIYQLDPNTLEYKKLNRSVIMLGFVNTEIVKRGSIVSVGVYHIDFNKAVRLIDKLIDGENIVRESRNREQVTIELLKNGVRVVIRSVPMNDSSRGYKFNYSFVDVASLELEDFSFRYTRIQMSTNNFNVKEKYKDSYEHRFMLY